MSWPLVPLSDAALIQMGTAPPGSSYNEASEGVPMIAGAGDYGEKYPLPKKWTTQPTRMTDEGDLIVCVRATIGDLNWADKKYCLGRGVAGVRVKKNVADLGYLAHVIASKKRELTKLGTGSTFLAIRRDDLKGLQIPLPPLEEQKRIAAILDKADAIRRKRQQAIELADQFLRSVFLDMFGDPVTNPKGWEVCAVGEITECIVPGRDKPKTFTGDTPWITTNNLAHMGITKKAETFIGLTKDEISFVKAKIIPTRSVVMTCVGDLGVISIVGEPMVINQQLHAFQCGADLVSEYLMYALSFQKSYMLKMASSTTVPYMNKTVCNSIPILKPPVHLQERFTAIFSMVYENTNRLQISSKQIEDLYRSITQSAFNGELMSTKAA